MDDRGPAFDLRGTWGRSSDGVVVGAGLIVFAGFSVSGIDGTSLLIAAPVASALTVLVVSLPAVIRRMSGVGQPQVTVG